MKPESRLQRQCRKALELAFPGSFWYKVHGGPFTPAGIPDLAGVVGGRACFLEIKTDTGEVSVVQHARMRTLARAGAIVGVFTTPEACVEHVRASLARRQSP